MKRLAAFLALQTLLTLTSLSMAGVYYLDDGASHTFDYTTTPLYGDDPVFLDYNIANSPGTHLDFNKTAKVGVLRSYNNASINVTGGNIEFFSGYGKSSLVMSGGSVFSTIKNFNESNTIMSGGSVGSVQAFDNSTITISGGLVTGILFAFVNGIVYLDGSDFIVTDLDGKSTSLSYGDKLGDFGSSVEHRSPINSLIYYYEGTITGKLADGSELNNKFRILNNNYYAGIADIMIVPEPCGLVLLGLGSLYLRKRNHHALAPRN